MHRGGALCPARHPNLSVGARRSAKCNRRNAEYELVTVVLCIDTHLFCFGGHFTVARRRGPLAPKMTHGRPFEGPHADQLCEAPWSQKAAGTGAAAADARSRKTTRLAGRVELLVTGTSSSSSSGCLG